MFSLSEILFILVLALVVVGPKQIPELARQLGRFMNEMKRASEAITREMRSPTQRIKDEVMKPVTPAPKTPTKTEAASDTTVVPTAEAHAERKVESKFEIKPEINPDAKPISKPGSSDV